jgi:hypothetical protein
MKALYEKLVNHSSNNISISEVLQMIRYLEQPISSESEESKLLQRRADAENKVNEEYNNTKSLHYRDNERFSWAIKAIKGVYEEDLAKLKPISSVEKMAEERLNKTRVGYNILPKVFYIDYLRTMIGLYDNSQISLSRFQEILNEDAYHFYKANNSLDELEKWVKKQNYFTGIEKLDLLKKIKELQK